jgi:AcrR family transcriptional regulator
MVARSDESMAQRPARGTRPANRRDLILVAAGDLFYRKGYAQVSMKDIAEAVAIGPSALYRHFSSKQELLYAVVADALGVVDTLLDQLLADQSVDPGTAIGATMLEHRAIGVLWHAEARHLGQGARARLRQRLRRIGSRLADVVACGRFATDGVTVDAVTADLLAWCVLAVTTSVSFHSAELPTDRFIGVLADMTRSAALATVPPLRRARASGADEGGSWSSSRREAILTSAIKLFAHNGFASVGVEDIGASVGISGPSVYNHFAAKEDILIAAITRGRELLHADMHRQVGRAGGPDDALRRVLSGYAAFVFESPESIQVLISETGQLPDEEQRRTRAAQHDYIDQWVHLLRQTKPHWDATECRIRVQAALGVVNDVAATPHLRGFADAETAATAVSAAVLGLD